MTDGERAFRELLEGLSEIQLRELCIEAVRTIRRSGDRNSTEVLDPRTFQHALVPILMRHRGEQPGSRPTLASLETHFEESWAVPIVQFFAWLVRSGLAFGHQHNRFRLFPAGLAFFDSNDEVHPLVPGALRRLRERNPTLPDDVMDLLEDAHACFGHGLLRPAIALLGVAFETCAHAVLEGLARRAVMTSPSDPRGAAQRIVAIRSALPMRFPGNAGPMLEARAGAARACDFADELRARRNDASHPRARFPFDDRQEVEEFMVSAMRFLPGLWAVAWVSAARAPSSELIAA